MIFSYKKLKEIANLSSDITIDQVVNAINTIGFEVESVKDFGKVSGLKFGEVQKVYKNPNGDKLTVCEIRFSDITRTIQTTATNVKEQMIVLAFVPGSKLGDTVIESKDLKGIKSEGMLTSIEEFGIDKELVREEMFDQITDYKDVALLSVDPIEYLQLDDKLIDVDILSNRSDANSYYVMAKEIGAYFNKLALIPSIRESSIDSDLIVNNGESVSLAVMEAKKDFEITIPEMILLGKSGVKSINDIVDLTNLTLLMSGQPTHAYLKKDIAKDLRAKKTSGKVTILGGKEVELDNNLVITSNSIPVSIAGVIGLEQFSVKNYQDFVIEMGIFNIKNIRDSIKAIKINNASSSQSSKILSLGTTTLAIAYLTNRLNIFSKVLNFTNPTPKEVDYEPKHTSLLAGFNITGEENYRKTIDKLELLGYKFLDNKVVVPTYRHDIDHQQDIDEEIFRFYGYDSFTPVAPKIINNQVSEVSEINELVSSMGYQEVKTYTLISESRNSINPFEFKNTIQLSTYVSKEREVIRNSLAQSLLEVVEYNSKRNIQRINIFTQGMINDGNFALGLATNTKTFNELKQDIINIIDVPITFERLVDDKLHPGVSAKIIHNKKMIGWVGKVHPSINKTDAFIGEVLLPNKQKVSFVTYDSSPLKHRDITFSIDPKEDIKPHIDQIKRFDIFDVFIKDTYKKEEKINITVRVIAKDEVIKEIDNKFNKIN